MKIIACPTCEQDVQWDMNRLQKLGERWVMACEKCGDQCFSGRKGNDSWRHTIDG
ncbi:hypothetical protein [Brevibacillus sp. MER 51]|uniref:hypothetical protein n=1 Tax=Brevibacillus sp. MER 51 TaxID=2939560 RepID=UPI00203F7C81|nr:hypothetical protein [Brevibacillus sp. MER 51]